MSHAGHDLCSGVVLLVIVRVSAKVVDVLFDCINVVVAECRSVVLVVVLGDEGTLNAQRGSRLGVHVFASRSPKSLVG